MVENRKPRLKQAAEDAATTKKAANTAPLRRRRAVALATEVPHLTKRIIGKNGFAEAGLITHWTEIVGAALGGMSIPLKLSFPKTAAAKEGAAPKGARQDGTLTIQAPAAAALEIQHMAPLILERINGHFGYRAIARLRLVQGPGPARRPKKPINSRPLDPNRQAALETALATLGKDDLAESLRRLGTALYRRGRAD